MVELTALVSGAAALLIRGTNEDGVPGTASGLAGVADPAVLDAVRGWAAADGPDGEQFLALADLLHARCEEDPRLARAVADASRAAAADALRALADDFGGRGFDGAAGWARAQAGALGVAVGAPAPRQASPDRRAQDEPAQDGPAQPWLLAEVVPFRPEAGRHGGPAEAATDPGYELAAGETLLDEMLLEQMLAEVSPAAAS